MSLLIELAVLFVLFRMVRLSERGAHPDATATDRALRRWAVPIVLGACLAIEKSL